MSNPTFSFQMAIPSNSQPDLIEGLVTLVAADGKTVLNKYRATSSRAWHQYWGSWRNSGGLIPPDESYTVATTAIQLPDVDGVRGSFFPISPYSIQTINDLRADFGMHNDPNRAYAPGSLGCIVMMTENGWAAYKRDVAKIADAGFKAINLRVKYSKA
jgi:hypothetical protein